MENRSVTARRAIGARAVAVSAVVVVLVIIVGFELSQSTSQLSTSMTSAASSASTQTTTASSSMSLAYLSTSGGCSAGGKAAPCWGSPAYVFDCLSSAQTQQGCTRLVVTTSPDWNFTVTVRYPFTNQTAPSWANCLWSVPGQVPGQGFGLCTQVSSTSFTVGMPAPPPQHGIPRVNFSRGSRSLWP